MNWTDHHPEMPHASFDGGHLDCGSGLLLLIRRHLDPLQPGQLLEICSTEPSVEDELPAWARLTGNELVSGIRHGTMRRYLVRKASKSARDSARVAASAAPTRPENAAIERRHGRTEFSPLAVTGIGSWPRPRWLLRALHEHLEGRLDEREFQESADDAVRLAAQAQETAGVDLITDGEQRRDGYASFVGMRLDGCQLVPIVDLLPYVSDPDRFAADLKALDVPASEMRQAVVRERLRRTRPIAGHELAFLRSVTSRPIKIALPGPYLLTRMLSLDCVSDQVYADRESLAADIVPLLREEAAALLAEGAAIVQFDEPVLTEVVFGKPAKDRSFMCGALAERRDPREELAFAESLLSSVLQGLPRERIALHVCRGNWSRDETVALSGSYEPLIPLLARVPVGILMLELCTERAGDMAVLGDLPRNRRIGVGVVNQKSERIEPVEEIAARIRRAADVFGIERLLLNPDCGFATFADSPVSSSAIAQAKLSAIVAARQMFPY